MVTKYTTQDINNRGKWYIYEGEQAYGNSLYFTLFSVNLKLL